MPRNIRFMRIRVRVNPWIPVVSGFMLKMDNGSKTWIQCRYERVHKLCNRCGMIGHTQGQCTLSMDDIEMMIFRQSYRIQNLHQVRYGFDALEPLFNNDLRAFYNRRRRWNSRPNFSNLHFTLITHPTGPCMYPPHLQVHPIHMQPVFVDILTLKHPPSLTLSHLPLYKGAKIPKTHHMQGVLRFPPKPL